MNASRQIHVVKKLFQIAKEDRGNVESALTLIPLMILFLTAAQIIFGVFARASLDQSTQGEVAYRALGAPSDPTLLSKPPISLPLPGGGSILVGERSMKVTGITPLLPLGELLTSRGVAVQE